MKLFHQMLALAAVAILAVGCGDDPKTTPTGGNDTATAETADDAATTDATTDEDAATTDSTGTDAADDAVTPPGDATQTGAAFPGCTSAQDQAFRQSLQADQAKGDKYRGDVSDCTLKKGCLAKATDNEKIKCINDCLDALYSAEVSTTCDACYALTGWCGAAKCLTSCAANSASQACQDCLAQNCDPAAGACIAGQCDPYADEHCAQK